MSRVGGRARAASTTAADEVLEHFLAAGAGLRIDGPADHLRREIVEAFSAGENGLAEANVPARVALVDEGLKLPVLEQLCRIQ